MQYPRSTIPRYWEIVQAEAAKTEVALAVGRVVLVAFFLATDLLFLWLGPVRAGYRVPAAAVATDLAFLLSACVTLALVRRYRRHLAVWFRYAITLADFLFVGLYTLSYRGSGLPPDMLLGMFGMFVMLLVTLYAFRFDHLTTIFATAVGLLVTVGLGLAAQAEPGLMVAISAAVAAAGGICTFLSWRYRAVVHHVVTRSRFERFLPRQVVDDLVRGTGETELGGKELEVTVLFADIRGFSALCEHRRPLEMLDLLNDFFTVLSAVVFRHSGMLDKFVGDSVMAVFGAPTSCPDDAIRAIRCAREMREVVRQVNAERGGRSQPEIAFCIGLHTGVVVAGNLGSPERMEYTVIGDTVNVAARVEGLTRQLDTDILITAATLEAAGEAIEAEPRGTVNVRNRAEPLTVYALR